ncbi:MAG: UvrD-helicase domain-containing protein, partial [Acidobacteria bacterium]|nr:UvrD-helicase domain-containing protein [Acidobacteriota bacterium]
MSEAAMTMVAVAPQPVDPDARARQIAVDPRQNVVLEASAATGKTSVLVFRYINLLKAGVDPASILAMTFTR